MTNRSRTSILFLLLAILSITDALAQSAAAGPSPFTWGVQLRMRIESNDNATTLARDAAGGASYMRNRSSVFAKYRPLSTFSLDAKLTNEMRYYLVPESRAFEGDEIFFDQLYVTWDSIAALPLTLTAGRQNLMLGEGFVVMDGGPLDGSRSAYFNAARADWAFSPTSRLMFAYMYQPERDKFLPVIDDKKRKLVEQPEEGFVLYYTGTVASGGLQAYLIRKNIYSIDGLPTTAHINSPGLRYDYPLFTDFNVVGEGAYQFGTWNSETMRAYGGYFYGQYKTGQKGFIPGVLTLGGIHLSGDDQATPENEGWDPLFSRWPKWSEAYIYTLAPERLPAYWTNLSSVFGKVAFVVTPDITFSFDYHHMTAAKAPNVLKKIPGGTGTVRGRLLIAKLSYQIQKSLSGHVWYEGFKPGDYYFDGANAYGWVRMEVIVNL
jgi:hypothetical protein